eukprot:m.121343 g.121343  ORF g.121343 m.121343 type:complete len:747 (+) comp9376_c1_seq2:150-2390(+)
MTTINFLEETNLDESEFFNENYNEDRLLLENVGSDGDGDEDDDDDTNLHLWTGQGRWQPRQPNSINSTNNNDDDDTILPGTIQVTTQPAGNRVLQHSTQFNFDETATQSNSKKVTIACQTDPLLINNLPSAVMYQNRPTSAIAQGGIARRRTGNFERRRGKAKTSMANDNQPVFELDSPKRLQERENVRKQLGFFGLLWFDLKVWWKLKRTRRRDPIPIWRGQIKKIEGIFGNGMATFFIFLRWLFLMNLFIAICYLCFLVIPMAIQYDYSLNNETFVWVNTFDGQGYLGLLWFFYGGYNEISGYRMELAYVLVPIAVLVICLFTTVNSAFKSISNSALIRIDTKIPFSLLGLASWDYSINKHEGVTNLQHVISHAIKDALAEDQVKTSIKELKHASKWTKRKLYGRRALGWFLWMLIVAGCFAAVWFVIKSKYKDTYLAPAIFSFINGGLPLLIIRIPKIERYKHPKTINKITTARVFLLRVLTIFALMYGYFEETKLTDYNEQQKVSYEDGGRFNQSTCAGTVIGQDVYRLFLVDTVIGLLQRFLSTLFWYYWLKRRLEMDLVQWSLHLLYRQALVWLGMCFAPVIPIISIFTNLIYFYFYVALVHGWYRPPSTRYDQSSNMSVFLFFLAVTLFLMVIPLAWALTEYNPNCGIYGPAAYTTWFSGVAKWISSSSGPLADMFNVLFNPVFIGCIFILIFVYIFLLRLRVYKLKHIIKEADLEANELRADKKYLLIANNLQKDVTV